MNLRKMRRMPPDCREVAAVLQSFLDGELAPEQVGMVAEHLEHCERCGLEAHLYGQVMASLAGLRSAPDAGAMDRLRSFADRLTRAE